jgi:nucleoside-diphosphate-sugar epimerase
MSEHKAHPLYHLLCLGFGYSAQALAAALDPTTWRVSGTVRDKKAHASVRPVTLIPFAEAGAAIAEATHILISIPPDTRGDPTLRRHASRFAGLTHLKWLGYLSTTGVYGDTGGRPVDEAAALVPTVDRSRRRIKAEFDWQDHAAAHNLPLHIFRLAGIYGPGRSPLDQVRAGTARRIAKPGHAFSRIHVDDIVAALTLSMSNPQPGAIYNLCDDAPAEQVDVVAYACELLGQEPPSAIPFEEAEPTMSALQRSFWDDNRRIDNTKAKTELGLVLKYPTYRDGLMAIQAALLNDPKA